VAFERIPLKAQQRKSVHAHYFMVIKAREKSEASGLVIAVGYDIMQ
jgi:hypothetical protein